MNIGLIDVDGNFPKADGRTVHDFDRRFQAEDEGLISPHEYFRWDMLDKPLQYSIMF